MNSQNKLFRRYSVVLLVLLFVGCSKFLLPWKQIEYKNDNQIKIFKTEMNKDDAIKILEPCITSANWGFVKNVKNKIKIKGNSHSLKIFPENTVCKVDDNLVIYTFLKPNEVYNKETWTLVTPNEKCIHKRTYWDCINEGIYTLDTPNKDEMTILFDSDDNRKMWAKSICFNRVKNRVIDKERIAYDKCIEWWAFLRSSGNQNIYDYDGDESIVSTRLEYSDVKTIKLFECTLLRGVDYEIGLFNEANELIFYFTLPSNEEGMEKAQQLLAALSILMPHAKEEYNDNRYLVGPSRWRFGGGPSRNIDIKKTTSWAPGKSMKIEAEESVSSNEEIAQSVTDQSSEPKASDFGPLVNPNKTVYAPFEEIILEFSNFPGNEHDWISIATPSSENTDYQTYSYTGEGLKNGTINLGGIEAGKYEIRYYYDWENGKYDYHVLGNLIVADK